LQTVEKWATRSDAWTPQDDEHLASLVLYHIRTGSTQLKAFEDAANQLGRTAAACGYRWNGVVRKTYQQQIEEAKQERKRSQKAQTSNEDNVSAEIAPIQSIDSSESMKEVILFLQAFDAGYQKLLNQLQTLEQEKQLLLNRIEELQSKVSFGSETDNEPLTPEQLEEDSKTLFAIMERARKLLGDGAKSRSDS
jgi:prespore-specific regulator